MNEEHLLNQLIRHEGLKLFPYHCSENFLTIGVGRNLDSVGISEEEARSLLANDVKRVKADLDRKVPWWRQLSEARQIVMIDMCFNLGIGSLMKFKNALSCIESGDFVQAREEILDSRYARQVKGRAVALADAMRDDTLVEV